ncbi:lysine-specific demethylase 8-like isoform X2 [Limulus polyphemus]|uniref:Lysine-specific demethylase 8-like isoform X2 n=1 Tax=Limulus polyphemus TaxID=6850 RepID=A0ABM1SCL7_LIMPO|nr:lysine-specific demethylase 8-like isoform X2 [Limulus polyphemus]
MFAKKNLPQHMKQLIPTDRKHLMLEGNVQRTVVGEPIMFLLNQCVEGLYTPVQVTETEDEAECSTAENAHLASTAQVLLDITWEKLNTGYWKDVDISWRYIYSYASLFKVLFLCCDETQTFQSKYIKQSQFPLINKSAEVLQVASPSLETFEATYMKQLQPVIITQAIDYWPALSTHRWSTDYLLQVAGPRTVPVELGARYTDVNWSQKLMTVQKFVDTYILKKNGQTDVAYLAQHQLFDQIRELREDISIPTYCCLAETDNEVDINGWFGPEGTVSPLHYDPKHNLLAQIVGKKYVRLYSEETTPFLYPYEERLLNNTSRVDVENPDLEKFPLFAKAKCKECIIEPGQLLYIPPRCWHYVRSLSTSFSVSFWWQ